MSKFLFLLIEIACVFVTAWLFSIEPAKEYGWFAGIFHGLWALPNYVMSLILDDYIFKAVLFSKMYNIFWWIFVVLSAFYYIGFIIRFFKN